MVQEREICAHALDCRTLEKVLCNVTHPSCEVALPFMRGSILGAEDSAITKPAYAFHW
jgi:hypothetical protein